MGGELVAALLPGEFVLVDLIKLCIFPAPFLTLHFKFQLWRQKPPLLGAFIIVVSVNCISLYLVRLYVSFSTDTLR